MIRNLIVFLVFFTGFHPFALWGQDTITFQCYNLDSISWELSLTNCSTPEIDSFRILTRTDRNSDFRILFSGNDPSQRGFKNDALKSHDALLAEYFLRCPDEKTLRSDTLSLTALRDAVQLDSVRVLANGDVRLTWKEKPVDGIHYVVNAAVGGSSSVLASDLSQNSYTDTRGRAADNVEYYSISAALGCGYTFPEPDSFYHTSLLRSSLTECSGRIDFEFTPFSYWKGGTSSATLFVERNGEVIDSLELVPGETSFAYEGLRNQSHYSFYVRESGPDVDQRALSNPIILHTDFYEPIRWIVIDDFSFDENNEITLSWSTNEHMPANSFNLHSPTDSLAISPADLITQDQNYRYAYAFDQQVESVQYRISLQDSCGHFVFSHPKTPLITQGQLTNDNQLIIEWSDVQDEEWTIHTYEIFYLENGSYRSLGDVQGNTQHFEHTFGDTQPLDSLCYYVVAHGEVEFQDADSTAELALRSNTVCLYGETVVELPNAFHPGRTPYKPIIVPSSNLSTYTFRVFDRYGNLVFESLHPDEGWDGSYQGRIGFADVFVAQVEFTTVSGERYEKSGSVLLFP